MPIAPNQISKRIFSLDTETTGLDLYLGARPFFVTFFNGQVNTYFEWPVDPLTRKVQANVPDLIEIQGLINSADKLVLTNAKFDHGMLRELFKDFGLSLVWDWSKVEDLLISAHLIASNQPKDLTTLALRYLNQNILPVEKTLQDIVQECRKLVTRKFNSDLFGNWIIARKGLPMMPSVKGGKDSKVWPNDMWLPRALILWCAEYKKYDIIPQGQNQEKLLSHSWLEAVANYSNTDSTVTLFIHQRHLSIIGQRGYEKLYRERLRVLEIAAQMEETGIVLNKDRLYAQRGKYKGESAIALKKLRGIATKRGYDLDLPKGGRNKSLDHFLLGYDQYNCPKCDYETRVVKGATIKTDCPKCEAKSEKGVVLKKTTVTNLDLPVVKTSLKTGAPSVDTKVLEHFEATLPPGEDLDFIKILRGKRSRDTAISYLDGYERFWVPDSSGWFRLHPSLNPTATETLRWNSKNPNQQNISKRESFNLRACFGPGPGREWWNMDYQNLELRIPAYEANEQILIGLFEHPNDPPYYGSNHLLNFSIIYKDIWARELAEVGIEKVGPYCKEKYASSYYQWAKNTGFCIIYGGQRAKADATSHRKGSYDLLDSQLSGLTKLKNKCIKFARECGYVETMPDKTVDPKHGYPLLCRGGKRGGEGVSPTLPLNYHVQGTAMWVTAKAMLRCASYVKSVGGSMVMQIHDEMVFDLPARGKENLPIVKELKRLMELSGDDLGIPLPVSASYHPVTWDKTEKIDED